MRRRRWPSSVPFPALSPCRAPSPRRSRLTWPPRLRGASSPPRWSAARVSAPAARWCKLPIPKCRRRLMRPLPTRRRSRRVSGWPAAPRSTSSASRKWPMRAPRPSSRRPSLPAPACWSRRSFWRRRTSTGAARRPRRAGVSTRSRATAQSSSISRCWPPGRDWRWRGKPWPTPSCARPSTGSSISGSCRSAITSPAVRRSPR